MMSNCRGGKSTLGYIISDEVARMWIKRIVIVICGPRLLLQIDTQSYLLSIRSSGVKLSNLTFPRGMAHCCYSFCRAATSENPENRRTSPEIGRRGVIYVIRAIAKIQVKISLKRIKEHFENLIDKEQTGFHPEFLCTNHMNTLQIILEQFAEFRTWFHLIFFHFKKGFDSVKMYCIWNALRRTAFRRNLKHIIRATYEA